MRYDRLLTALERARDRYEGEVRRLITSAVNDDRNTTSQILSDKPRRKYRKRSKRVTAKGFSYSGKHWTQTPAGRKRLAASMRLMHARKREAA